MRDIVPKLSYMWTKIFNLEQSLFPMLQEELRLKALSTKEQKLIRILDFANIEEQVHVVTITNPPKDRQEMARAFVAKSVYNIQTTRDLIDRLKIDRTLRIICGWRYPKDIPSEAKFSRAFEEFSRNNIAQKAQDVFIQEYLSDTLFLYNATDATKIPLRTHCTTPPSQIIQVSKSKNRMRLEK